MAKMIQVHFVGAPPQYCFEQYEVSGYLLPLTKEGRNDIKLLIGSSPGRVWDGAPALGVRVSGGDAEGGDWQ